MVLGKLASRMQKMKLDHYLTSYTKMNSKWFKDLNVRPETIKFLGKTVGGNLIAIGLSCVFVTLSPKARETKAKIS